MACGSGKHLLETENESEVAQSCPTLCDSMDYSLPGSSVHGIFQARILGWVAISFSRGSSQPKNTGVGCHFLQGIFPTQGLNPGLLHCGQTLHRLSHQGSPRDRERTNK